MIVKEVFIPKLNLDITFIIGQNAAENFQIIDDSQPDDLWFHVAEFPSCHVIAKINDIMANINRKDIKYIVKQGAILCKQYSKYKSVKNLEIIYTEISNVQKTNVIGSVITSNTKNVTI
jgi:predicted ribosome quality control (RQC) complex YloA/Tae2 family protein